MMDHDNHQKAQIVETGIPYIMLRHAKMNVVNLNDIANF